MAMTDYLNDMPAQGNRKVVLVGTGFVGMSMAYTLMTLILKRQKGKQWT